MTFWTGKEDADASAEAASRGSWVRIMELASVRGSESGGRSESGIALASEGEEVIVVGEQEVWPWFMFMRTIRLSLMPSNYIRGT